MKNIITIFGDEYSSVIGKLDKDGYAPFIDGIHQREIRWLKENFKEEHRFFEVINGVLCGYNSETIDDSCAPNMGITLGEKVDEEFWGDLMNYLSCLYDLDYDSERAERGARSLDKAEKDRIFGAEFDTLPEFDRKGVGKWEVSDGKRTKCEVMERGGIVRLEGEPPRIDGYYEINSVLLDSLDIMIYEIKKPGVVMPFTVIVRNWSVVGHERLFTDIYGSLDWDRDISYSRYDYPYLKWLWKHLELPGEFTRNMVDKRAYDCYPREGRLPDPEPEVYRWSLEKVAEIVKKKEMGKWGL